MHGMSRWSLAVAGLVTLAAGSGAGADEPRPTITHAFLATGGETYLRDGSGSITWRYPGSTRDGWVLPGGNILLAISKGKDYPGGGVVDGERRESWWNLCTQREDRR